MSASPEIPARSTINSIPPHNNVIYDTNAKVRGDRQFTEDAQSIGTLDQPPSLMILSEEDKLFGDVKGVSMRSAFAPPPITAGQKQVFRGAICPALSPNIISALEQQLQAQYENVLAQTALEQSSKLADQWQIKHQKLQTVQDYTSLKDFLALLANLCKMSDFVQSNMLLFVKG